MQNVSSASPDHRLFVTLLALSAMIPSLRAAPLIIAHRGASAVAPENTASSIREAIRLGAKVIEFDVRATRDRQLVLFHDDKLDRVAGCPGTIETCDWATVQTYDVGKWFTKGAFAGEKVLRFDDALRLCLEGGATPLIERKTGEAHEYADVIRRLDVADQVIVQSFDWKFLAAFRKEMPSMKIGALGSKKLDAAKRASLSQLRPDWVGWNFADLKPTDLPLLRDLGAKIALWTVNDPSVAKTWVEAGVEAIITDVPDRIAAAFGG